MTRPLLLDLFCGAGGAAAGYHPYRLALTDHLTPPPQGAA